MKEHQKYSTVEVETVVTAESYDEFYEHLSQIIGEVGARQILAAY